VSIDPIFLDGSGSYQPPLPGTVGSMLTAETRKVPASPGPVAELGLFLALPPAPGARLVGLTWAGKSDARPLGGGEVLLPEAIITRRRFDSSGDGDVLIDQDVRLTDDGGELVRQAQASWCAGRASVPGPDLATDEIASPAWGAALAARLGGDPAFASSVSTFDGSIGLASRSSAGLVAVEFRIYRGAIIETGRKTLDGATYAVEADALTWAELITGRYDDYVRCAARGLFTVRGSGFQYLRLTKTMRIMVWHARTMRQEARRG
jgi:hypothetical protein